MTHRDIRLDAIRGIAILLAMGWHLNETSNFLPFQILMAPGQTIGWAGVDLFFVLSGFLVGNLIISECVSTEKFDLKRFFIRRAFRLWPVLYAYVFAQLIFGRYEWQSFLPQTLFHLQNYFYTPFTHLWSLAVEEHFYLISALVFPALLIKRKNSTGLVFLLAAIIAICLLLRIAAVSNSIDHFVIKSQTHFRMDSIAVGVLLAAISSFHAERFQALLNKTFLWLILFVFCTAFLIYGSDTMYFEATKYTAAYVASAAAILIALKAPTSVANTRLTKVLALLGIYSYSIYIWHNALARAARAVAHRIFNDIPIELIVFINYISAIIAAIVISKLIEHPAMALRDRLFPSTLSLKSNLTSNDVASKTQPQKPMEMNN
jgi:peptidoglycan/LPS O-acetylase OafA/YrhL